MTPTEIRAATDAQLRRRLEEIERRPFSREAKAIYQALVDRARMPAGAMPSKQQDTK